MTNRHQTNLEIIIRLSDVIHRHPLTNLEEIIKTYCVGEAHNTFYEESSETLERLKENASKLMDVPSSDPSEITSMCLDRLKEIVDTYPDQRFIQICENYLFGQCEDPMRWLMTTEDKLFEVHSHRNEVLKRREEDPMEEEDVESIQKFIDFLKLCNPAH